MDWMTLIKFIIELIMKLLAKERAAAVAGFNGPVIAAVEAFNAADARLSSPK